MRALMHISSRAAAFTLLSLFAGAALAAPSAGKSLPDPEPEMVRGPYIVVDAETGRVFDERDAVRPWYPASTSKLMTIYVVFRAVAAGEIALADEIAYSRNAANQPPSKMAFSPGTTLTLDNALKIMMVKSANDVAVAVAEAVGGSVAGFAERMNREAARLGMTESHFVNPHGLPDEQQVSSARDMAVLARALLTDFPGRRHFYKLHAIEFGGKVLRNYNTLVRRYVGTTGMKTGFICASGYNLVASARRDGREVIAVVFGEYGGGARAEHAAALLEAGFKADPEAADETLATVDSGRQYSEPLDMRPYVCGDKRVAAASEANEEGAESKAVSYLAPPIFLGPPVKVTVNVPAKHGEPGFLARVPRPRPDQVGDEPRTGVAFAPTADASTESAPAAAIGDAVGSAIPLRNLPASE